MKKKNIIVIAVIVGVVLLSLFSVCGYKWYKNKEDDKKHAKIVENTKKEYAFYLENKTSKKKDDTTKILNTVIEESKKNENINTEVFVTSIFTNTKFSNENIDTLISSVDSELEKYSEQHLEKLNENDLKKSIRSKKVDEETVLKLYNEHKFIKNIKEEKEKRKKYIEELTSLKNDLNYFKEKTNEFYFKENKIYAKNDEILNKLNELNNKYKLNLTIEKEVIVTTPTTSENKGSGNYITILCYHGILDNPWGLSELFVKVNEFEAQMKYLSENGYTTLFASEIASAGNYEKPVIITFDDGYADVYNNAFPILKKYNLKANVYMISGWINGDVYMTTAMTKEMSDSPLIEIGSHTVNHKALAALSDEEIDYELKTSKQDLENMIGKSVDVIAYPTGSFDQRVTKITSQYYKYGLSTINGVEYPGALNTFTLKRKYVYRKYNVNQFAGLL